MDDTRDETQNNEHESQSGQDLGGKIRLVPIDHDEYDALADLFLGGGGLAPDPIGELGEQEDAARHEPHHGTHTPVLHLTQHEPEQDAGEEITDDASEHHQPFRVEAAGLRVLETLRETDQRASTLMSQLLEEETLSEGIQREHEGHSQGIEMIELPKPRVEVVVLGHLPIRATLWARQYACAQARERGEVVALVRAASGSTAIDLITGSEPMAIEGRATLEQAIDDVSELADRVVIRVDEHSEPELIERGEVETITVLTGADEAAVVASYRLIKTLNATLADRYEDEHMPTLRLAVMGAGREKALDACAKLRTAVETFIAHPVEIVVGSGRIDATGTANIYRAGRACVGGEVIDLLVDAANRERGVEAEPFEVDLGSQDFVRHEESVPETVEAVEETARSQTRDQLEKVVSADAPVPASEQRETACPGLRDGLSALITGLRRIEARCPKAPGVELAIDDRGRLHLIVCDLDTSDPLKRLYAAQNWSRDHLSLLLAAEPALNQPSTDRSIDTDAMMHLISAEPAALSNMYDTPVRMYALARVRMGGVIAQVATPLN